MCVEHGKGVRSKTDFYQPARFTVAEETVLPQDYCRTTVRAVIRGGYAAGEPSAMHLTCMTGLMDVAPFSFLS